MEGTSITINGGSNSNSFGGSGGGGGGGAGGTEKRGGTGTPSSPVLQCECPHMVWRFWIFGWRGGGVGSYTGAGGNGGNTLVAGGDGGRWLWVAGDESAGGNGAYGLLIQAKNIILGTIVANGISAATSGFGGGGGGGAGSMVFAYSSSYVAGNYYMFGGAGTRNRRLRKWRKRSKQTGDNL